MLDIRPFNSLDLDHKAYMVPAYVNIPVCETRAMQAIKSSLGLRRKTIERLRLAQAPGAIFQVKGRRDTVLVGLMLADDYESISYSAVRTIVHKAIKLMSIPGVPSSEEGVCFVGDGFRAHPRGSDRDESLVGFEMLCRALRKEQFRGIVYEPSEMRFHPSVIPEIEDERITGTHPIIDFDGKISPSIPPTLLRSLNKNRT
jgi:hypothetical protein